ELYPPQNRPHLAGAPLDRQRPESHLETVQQGCQRRRPGHDDSMLTLERINEAYAADDLSIEPLRRKKHQSKIGCPWRRDVLFGDGLGAQLNGSLKLSPRGLRRLDVRTFLGIEEPLIVLLRELRIDW